MHSSTVTLVLLSCIVALVNAQCSCQTKPPVDVKEPSIEVIHRGETCECGRRQYPVQVEVPKITEHRDAHYDFGFTVEQPQGAAPAEIKYTYDFHMEKPRPIVPPASLATYNFEVQNPVQQEVEVPKRYIYSSVVQRPSRIESEPSYLQGLVADVESPVQQEVEVPKRYIYSSVVQRPSRIESEQSYLQGLVADVESPVQQEVEVPKRYIYSSVIQRPHIQSEPSYIQGLVSHVDKVVVEKQDCPEKTNSGCMCNSYKPTVDLLQRCPRHGHLYRNGGPLYPSNPQRYNQLLSSFPQQIPDQVSTSFDRSKRESVNYSQTQHNLPALRENDPRRKMTEEERIHQIYEQNFREDPSVNIDELIRPKPLRATEVTQNYVNNNSELFGDVKTPDFISKIKLKVDEVRSNLRNQITKVVNKARLDTIRASHMIQKRSAQTPTESTESDLSEMFLGDDEHFDGSYEPIWITTHGESGEEHKEHVQEPKEPQVNAIEKSPSNRYRKHCERCGELTQKFPCPSCGAYPSEAAQPQRNPIPYNPGHVEFNTQPRHSFDNNGKFPASQQGDDVTVGSYYPGAFGELKDILNKNSKTIYSQNRRLGEDHLVQPMDFAHASDAIRFIQELTQRNNEQYNQDYYSNGNSYDVGASSPSYPVKRSFKIVPLAEKDDGSVFVKISPVTNSNNNKSKGNSFVYPKPYVNDAKRASGVEEKNFNEQKSKANFKPFVRDGKKYEILSLNANGSDEGSFGSEEDMEILKYVYSVHQNESQKQNSATKMIDLNKSENGGSTSAESHMET